MLTLCSALCILIYIYLHVNFRTVSLVFPLHSFHSWKDQSKERLTNLPQIFQVQSACKMSLASKSVLWTTKARPCSCQLFPETLVLSLNLKAANSTWMTDYLGCRQPLCSLWGSVHYRLSITTLYLLLIRQLFQFCLLPLNSVLLRYP